MACVAEAAAGALVAGWADRIRQYQKRIVIAVRRNVDHIQEMARGFPFGPQALFGAREKGDLAAVDGFG